jgi:hypothetical protein
VFTWITLFAIVEIGCVVGCRLGPGLVLASTVLRR